MSVSRKKLSLVMFLIIAFTAVIWILSSSDAYANPYVGGNSNCTWVAWDQAKKNTGVELPGWGNAGTWYNSAQAAGFAVGSTPRAKSIVVYAGNPGHVAYVADYNSGTKQIYVKEGGYLGGYHEGWTPIQPTYNGKLLGFIYLTGNPTPTPQPKKGKVMSRGYDRAIPDGDYIIVSNVGNKLQLDIAGDAIPAKNSTNVLLWGYTNRVQDVFTFKYNTSTKFYSIKQKGTNMALDVADGSLNEGANVQVYSSNNSNAQKWAISPVWKGNVVTGYRLEAACSGFSMDVYDGKAVNGTNIRMYSDNNSGAQSWLLIPYKPAQTIKDGKYILVSGLDANVELDVVGDTLNVSNGTNVRIWHHNTVEFANSALSQFNSFTVKHVGDGYYTLTHGSGKCLEVEGASHESPHNIQLWSSNNTYAQQWAITKLNDGYLLRARNSGMTMDVTDGQTKNGTNVRQCRWNGSLAQTWKFVPAEYTVTYNVNGGIWAPTAQTKYYKGNLTLSTSKPTHSTKEFVCWNTKADGTGINYYPGGIYVTDANVTLYAKWKNPDHKPTPVDPDPIPVIPDGQLGEDGTPYGKGASFEAADKAITAYGSEKDPVGSKAAPLLLRSKKQTKKSIKLAWNKPSDATKYVVYGNKCGKKNKMKKLKTLSKTSITIKKAVKKLAKGKYYKFIVISLDNNNKVISTSKIIHVVTKGGKVGNAKKVKTAAKKNKATIALDGIFKLKAKAIPYSKKLKIKKHRDIIFETSNKNVATVSSKGVISGKDKGTCYIYAYAQNGQYAKIKVTVTDTVSMTSYSKLIKKGNMIYCLADYMENESIYKITLKQGKATNKKQLSARGFNSAFSINGNFLFFIENDDEGGSYIRRINIKNGKSKALTPKNNNQFIDAYAVKGSKIYYRTNEHYSANKLNMVMGINGKNKKNTKCTIKMKHKRANTKQYSIITKDTGKDKGIHKLYLKTPRGKYYIRSVVW